MDRLVINQHREAELKKIRPVSYCYNYSFTFPSSHKIPSHSSNFSNINKQCKTGYIFQKRIFSLFRVSIRKKWFINLSSFFIPTNVQCLLQLGNNFSLPETNKKKMTIEFIKNIESNINKLPAPAQTFMRNKSISILNGLERSSFIFNDSDKLLKIKK